LFKIGLEMANAEFLKLSSEKVCRGKEEQIVLALNAHVWSAAVPHV
jgi:hypothetical protein